MSQEERYAHYNRDYYIGRACPESQSYDKKILRPGDMGAALCYAFGIDSYAEVCRILGIPQDNPRFLPETTFDRQYTTILNHQQRIPKKACDVGSGRGELVSAFYLCGIPSVGIEPSQDAIFISAHQTFKQWAIEAEGHDDFGYPVPVPVFWHSGLELSISLMSSEGIDTIIFCESIEHIPEAEFAAAWPIMVDMLRKTNGRLIITNWIDYHPIVPDGTGWDHVRLVDDAFYDSLAKEAKRTVFRQGSHLVLEF